MRRRKREEGFSLIELLIAVAIIMIIMGIAMPKLLSLRQNANATAAEGNLKALSNALNSYQSQYPNIGCPATLAALGPPQPGNGPNQGAADILDESMVAATTTPKQGYLYTYTPVSGTPCSSYTVTAAPQGSNGHRFFYMDQDGVIRYNDGSPATATSPIVGG